MTLQQVTPTYQIHIATQTGERLGLINNFNSVQVNMRLNGPHTCILTTPPTFTVQSRIRELEDWLIEDNWLEVWRGTNNSPLKMVGEAPFLIQEFDVTESAEGREDIRILAYSASVIADWPIVAYNAQSSQAAKTDNGDDMIKAIWAENAGADATDTDRNVSAYVTDEADLGAGASLTKNFSRKVVGDVFRSICEASANDGTRLYYDIVLPTPGDLSNRKLELRTYTGQRGINRGLGEANELIFSLDRLNLSRVSVRRSYADVVNYAYGLGQGVEDARNVQTASDTTRINESIWGRIKEGARSATHSNTDAGVTAEAKALLRQKRPRLEVDADVQQVPNSRLGVHYDHGDYVVVEARGQRYECILSPLQISYTRNGEETIRAKLRVETVIT